MILDLYKLYKTTFGNTPYHIGDLQKDTSEVTYGALPEHLRRTDKQAFTSKQIALNKTSAIGKEVWFPIEFWKSNTVALEIEACTVAVNLTKVIVRTPVSERKGSVKEQFSIDDYKFTIRGFLIGKNRKFPEDEIVKLKDLFETTEPVSLHGGYPELFLDESCRVAILTLDFPEAQGRSPWIRPFHLTCESDFVENLILD